MKFAIAVLAAVVVCAQASNLIAAPLAYSYGSYGSYGSPIPLAYSAPSYYNYASPLAYGAPLQYAAPLHYAAPIPAPLAYTAPIIAAARSEPTYTAINRGAVHTAPLPGHSESTSAVNLEPAPGTL